MKRNICFKKYYRFVAVNGFLQCSKREALRPNKHNLVPTSVPMDLLSTYDNDYTGEVSLLVSFDIIF